MSTTLEQTQYGFDRDSRRTWQKRPLTSMQDQAYQYDALSQVSAAARGSLNLNLNMTAISGTPAAAQCWDYDPTGNWRGYHAAANGTTTLDQHRVHDRGNRMTQIEDNPHNMILDRVGRMRQMAPDAEGDWDGKLEITWDAWSRITSVKNNGTVVGEYTYDGTHRRVTREVGGDTLHSYYNDAWRPVEERKNSETTANISYLWGSRHRDDLVRRDRATSGTTLNETRYILMDYFNPAALTDASGTVKERYSFSAFGVRTILNPDFTTRSSSECGIEFAFQGQFEDTETGWLNYGYRYYIPSLGRWSCKDPIGERGGWNLYGGAGNSPLNQVDLLGLEAGIGQKLDNGATPVTVPAPGDENQTGDAHFAARGRSLCDCNVAGEIIFTLSSDSNTAYGNVGDPKNYRMGANGKIGQDGQRVPIPSTDPDQLERDIVTQTESRPKCPSGHQTGTTTITLQHKPFAAGRGKGVILQLDVEWKYECQRSGDKCEEVQAFEYEVKNLQNSANGNL